MKVSWLSLFFLINFAILFFIVLSIYRYFRKRATTRPVVLRLKDLPSDEKTSPSPPHSPVAVLSNPSRTEYKPRSTSNYSSSSFSKATNSSEEKEKAKHAAAEVVVESAMDSNADKSRNLKQMNSISVQVFFNWNGHSWEAYEVLGIPAGSSVQAAEGAFDRMKTSVDIEMHPFLSAAVQAIRERHLTRSSSK